MHAHTEHLRPWGLTSTLLLSLLVMVVFVLLQSVMASQWDSPLRSYLYGHGVGQAYAVTTNGLLLSIVTNVSALVGTLLIIALVRLRRGLSLRHYLSLRAPAWCYIGLWLGALMLFIVFSEALNELLRRPPVPDFIVDAYVTAYFLPLLWLAVVVTGPLFEEVLFRGFLFTGLQSSRLGPWGAVLITAAAWAGLHLQYDAYEMGLIFALGIMLGIARWQSNSLPLTLFLHGAVNALAMLQVRLTAL